MATCKGMSNIRIILTVILLVTSIKISTAKLDHSVDTSVTDFIAILSKSWWNISFSSWTSSKVGDFYQEVIPRPSIASLLSNCPSKKTTSHHIYSAISHLEEWSRLIHIEGKCVFITAAIESKVHDNIFNGPLVSAVVYLDLAWLNCVVPSLHELCALSTYRTETQVIETPTPVVLDIHNRHLRVYNTLLSHLTHCASNLVRVLFLLKGHIILGIAGSVHVVASEQYITYPVKEPATTFGVHSITEVI